MTSPASPYVGRFAPSPSGPLHLGSVVAALASWLDARAHGGRWLVRMEDVDGPRTVPGADQVILAQLAALGMTSDDDVIYQSSRHAVYEAALARLTAMGLIYPCGCTRREIADSAPIHAVSGERPYPGTCRTGLQPGRGPRAWRVRMPAGVHCFEDRWLGRQCQDVAREVGDIVLRRADGQWAYQLAVVIDDADQGVTDIVRGADLLSSTARQQVLGQTLGLPLPRVMHVPLIVDTDGRKLSKQNGAPAVDTQAPLVALQAAWTALGFAPLPDASTAAAFLTQATDAWRLRWHIHPCSA
ncbi:tRNA glutamyl-Q(34) synthetase GluQRS [Achromobacter sp. GG226]|uniref:tRNA glutamyl-Q(34) synthetase GluQRS n=1 Tax=Verticiella alkaliphila TaxID=2779529 RepID=UPI001C0C0026|nr:tRNA glutamyl-Q(34) synthetase GluQRS [Verticiella sp. GG226]MBU4609090.1 tRNA glutamyl-Q(34) synthetase GluQRS [Verticiella sp. GG226]